MFKTKIDEKDIQELAYAWERCGLSLENIAEMQICHIRYINFLEAKLKECKTFEDEFLAK
jgi:hypothetical protein